MGPDSWLACDIAAQSPVAAPVRSGLAVRMDCTTIFNGNRVRARPRASQAWRTRGGGRTRRRGRPLACTLPQSGAAWGACAGVMTMSLGTSGPQAQRARACAAHHSPPSQRPSAVAPLSHAGSLLAHTLEPYSECASRAPSRAPGRRRAASWVAEGNGCGGSTLLILPAKNNSASRIPHNRISVNT